MAARDSIPARLGRYRIEREIGRGAMGVVYLARDPVIDRPIALKAVHLPEGLSAEQRSERFERFAREARAAGTLSHPGIVTVFDAGRDEEAGLCYIAMEYVAGRTLKDALREGRGLAPSEARDIAVRIGEALAHAHERGVVHRDLKPANILLGEDGAVKIADFGVARMESSDLTTDGTSLGSPAYMSPEQIRGAPIDGRSDLFSLGVVIHEMLSGTKPFAGPARDVVTYRIVNDPPAPLGPQVPAAWQRILSRLLAKTPEARYRDAPQLLEDLKASESASAGAHRAGAASDPDETIVEAPGLSAGWSAASRDAGRAAGSAAVRTVAAAMRGVAAAASAGLDRIRGSWRTAGRRRMIVVLGGAVAAVLLAGLFGIVQGVGCRVDVVLKHRLDEGRLRVIVDGREVIDRRFKGEVRATRVFGKDLFQRTAGEIEQSFLVDPGEHEFTVRVESSDGDGAWSRTFRESIDSGGSARIEIRAGKKFGKDMQIDWTTAGAGSPD